MIFNIDLAKRDIYSEQEFMGYFLKYGFIKFDKFVKKMRGKIPELYHIPLPVPVQCVWIGGDNEKLSKLNREMLNIMRALKPPISDIEFHYLCDEVKSKRQEIFDEEDRIALSEQPERLEEKNIDFWGCMKTIFFSLREKYFFERWEENQ